MIEQEVNGETYRIGKLPAKVQFHVARRLMPIVAKIGALSSEAPPTQSDEPGEAVEASPEPIAPEPNGEPRPQRQMSLFETKFFVTLAGALQELTDEDCDYVIDKCMAVITRRQGERYLPIWNKVANMPQFADIDMMVMLQLTVLTLQESLGSFMLAPSGLGQVGLPSGPNAK